MMRGSLTNGSAINTARLKLGLSQNELARRSKLDPKTVRKAEQGERVDLSSVTRLALVLQLEVTALIVTESSNEDSQLSHRDLILRWHYAWEAADLEGVLAVYHDDAVLELPGGPNIPFGGTFLGKAEIGQLHQNIWSTIRYAPLAVEEFNLMVSSDSVTLTGSKGIYMPNGELVPVPSIQVFKIRDHRFTSHVVQFDTLDFAKRMDFPI